MKKQVILGVVVGCLLIGAQSAYAVPAFQSGFNHGVEDAWSPNGDPIGSGAYINRTGNGFEQHSAAFIEGYTRGYCEVKGPDGRLYPHADDKLEPDFKCSDVLGMSLTSSFEDNKANRADREQEGVASDAQGRPCTYGPAHDQCLDQFIASKPQLYTAPSDTYTNGNATADILSGLEHGKADSNIDCPITTCNNWIMMRGHGFINQTQEFIKGYVYGFCSNPKFTSGGGQEAEQAGFDCDKGPESAFWALPASLDDNNTTYVTPAPDDKGSQH